MLCIISPALDLIFYVLDLTIRCFHGHFPGETSSMSTKTYTPVTTCSSTIIFSIAYFLCSFCYSSSASRLLLASRICLCLAFCSLVLRILAYMMQRCFSSTATCFMNKPYNYFLLYTSSKMALLLGSSRSILWLVSFKALFSSNYFIVRW